MFGGKARVPAGLVARTTCTPVQPLFWQSAIQADASRVVLFTRRAGVAVVLQQPHPSNKEQKERKTSESAAALLAGEHQGMTSGDARASVR